MATVQGEEQKRIGELIRQQRKKQKMTQTDLGSLLNLGTKAISDYEKGHIKVIPFAKRVKLADILDIPIAELLYSGEKTDRKCINIAFQYAKSVEPMGEKEMNTFFEILDSSPMNQFRKTVLKDCNNLPLGKAVEFVLEKINDNDTYYGDIEGLEVIFKTLFKSRGMSEADAESLSSYFGSLYLELFDS